MIAALREAGTLSKDRQELSLATKCPLDHEEQLIEQIPALAPPEGLLVVTMGKAGAVASDGEHVWRVRVPSIEPVNPIGSGDALASSLQLLRIRTAEELHPPAPSASSRADLPLE